MYVHGVLVAVAGLSFDEARLASADEHVGELASVVTDDHARGQLVVVADCMVAGELGVARSEFCTSAVGVDLLTDGRVHGKMLEGSKNGGHHNLWE